MTEMISIDIPRSITKRIQEIIDLGTCGYDNIQGYIEAALIKVSESSTSLRESWLIPPELSTIITTRD